MLALRPVLPVTNMARSLAFWKKLGFALAFCDREQPGQAEYAGLRGHGIELHLQTFTPGQLSATQVMNIRIETGSREDLERLHALWARQIDISAPLEEKPWGTVEFGFRDPDGTPFHIYCDS